MSLEIPPRDIDDRISIMNTRTAKKLGLVGKKGTVVGMAPFDEWGEPQYVIQFDGADEPVVVGGCIMRGIPRE